MSSLRNKTGKAFVWDLLGNYGGQIFYFIISIFLARLLDPAEFGLVGMSMVFISILKIFTDMGFAAALVQEKDTTSLTYSSVFYLNILIGLLFTFLVYSFAYLVGDFYNNDQITTIVQLLSFSFFISSFNIVQATILRKKLEFKQITLITLLTQFLGGILAVIMAYYDYGVYALVGQQLFVVSANVVLLWKTSDWKPSMEFSLKEIKKLFSFSSYVFSGQLINQIFKQLDTLVVGKVFSPSTLGYYSRADSINSLISKNSVGTFNRIFFPVLSQIKDDEERYNKVFLKVMNIVGTISIYLTGIFFLCGEEFIIYIFGQKWSPSVFIFQLIVIKGFSYPISALIVNAFFAKGKSKQNFHYGNIRRLNQAIPLVLAYYYDLEVFLYGIVLISVINWLLNLLFVHISLGISFWDQLRTIFGSLIVTSLSLLLLSVFLPEGLSIFWALINALTFTIFYFGYQRIFNKDLYAEYLIYKKALWKKLGRN